MLPLIVRPHYKWGFYYIFQWLSYFADLHIVKEKQLHRCEINCSLVYIQCINNLLYCRYSVFHITLVYMIYLVAGSGLANQLIVSKFNPQTLIFCCHSYSAAGQFFRPQSAQLLSGSCDTKSSGSQHPVVLVS